MPATLLSRAARAIAGLLLLFIILGLGYSVFTPIFENSDETLHYPYVKHLADGRGLPLAVPGQLWNQEGTQPPLYYAIVAATTFWLDSNNLLELLQRNPHWLFSEMRVLINDNQNLVLHGPMDAFPYRRAALAVHIGRWWSLLFGLLTVGGTFLLARLLFPNHLPLTFTATALTALNPQFLRVSATVSNDSLSAALTTWAVLAAFWFTEPAAKPAGAYSGVGKIFSRFPGAAAPLLLGLLAGLAILAKLSSLTTLVLVAFIVFWRLFFLNGTVSLSTLVRWWFIMGGVVVGLTGWWFWRNYALYGEWFVTETHLNLAGRGELSPVQIWQLRAEAERAYWATFGWGQIRPPEWMYELLFGFSRIGLFGLGLALLARLGKTYKPGWLPFNPPAVKLEVVTPLLLWVGLNFALYGRWLMEVGSVSHTRLVFPAIAAISLLLALGWHLWLPRRLAGWFSAGVTLALLLLNIYSLGWLIYPAFRASEPASQQANQLDLTFLDSLKLLGGGVSARQGNTATPGEVVWINAHWQTLAAMDKNYSVAATLLAPDGTVLARRETYPGLGLRPTRYLQPGDAFVDTYPLKLEADISQPIVARAAVTLFDFETPTRSGFPAIDSHHKEVTPVVGLIKIVPKTWPEYRPEHPVQVNFAGVISLIGYELNPNRETTGQKLGQAYTSTLTLYWQTLAPVAEDYTVFVHLLDGRGQVAAQVDGPPTGNAYPTSWWSPGETIADSRQVPLAPGVKTIRLGLYSLASGQRLPITQSTLPQEDNSVELVLP